MRGATVSARRLKSVFNALRARLGKVGHLPFGDPITQLILGVLSRDTPEAKACEGLERLRGTVVDYNELRVIPPIELAGVLNEFPDARLKCEDISRALNSIFAQEHTVSLDRLTTLSRKDALARLESIDGLEPYTRARIRLLGLRQHAIPLDEAMWACARADGIIDARCSLREAQQFLERQISEDTALEFVSLYKRHAWAEMGAAVKKREVERIISVPPDRTSRNMLQLVSAGGADDELPDLLASDADLLGAGDLEAEALDEGHDEAAEQKPAAARVRRRGGERRKATRGTAAHAAADKSNKPRATRPVRGAAVPAPGKPGRPSRGTTRAAAKGVRKPGRKTKLKAKSA